MKKINCLIADDEQLARNIMEEYISRVDNLHLVASCANGTEAFNVLNKQPVDLLFLDIKMPHLSGPELLQTATNLPPVILTTAYSDFALESYRFNVVDYLLKPIAFERFLKAIGKFQSIAGTWQTAPKEEAITWKEPFMYIRSEKKMQKLFLNEILFIEGLKDHVNVHLSNKTIITHQTLNAFEEKLPEARFIRIHRSFIISLHHISAFTARTVEIGLKEIPIGESYTAKVLDRLKMDG